MDSCNFDNERAAAKTVKLSKKEMRRFLDAVFNEVLLCNYTIESCCGRDAFLIIGRHPDCYKLYLETGYFIAIVKGFTFDFTAYSPWRFFGALAQRMKKIRKEIDRQNTESFNQAFDSIQEKHLEEMRAWLEEETKRLALRSIENTGVSVSTEVTPSNTTTVRTIA